MFNGVKSYIYMCLGGQLNGVKLPKRKRKSRRPRKHRQVPLPRLVEPRSLLKVGSSWLVSVPPKWFKAHKITPKKGDIVYVACNKDLTVLNPKDAAKFRQFVDARTTRARKRLLRKIPGPSRDKTRR